MRAPLLLALLAACSQEATFEGQVVDIWGNALPDATVVLDGTGESVKTDAHGYFSLPLIPGENALRVGKEGYIQDRLVVDVPEGGLDRGPVISLYERPSEHGFFVVGSSGYHRLDPEPLQILGNDLAKVSGLQKIETRVSRSPFEVVFDTELRMDEIARLGLELHRLEYRRTATVPGPFAPEEIDANLYMSAGEVDITIAPMRSRNAYRITTETPLEAGWYAFEIQDVLDPQAGRDLAQIPDAQKVAWAFEYRG